MCGALPDGELSPAKEQEAYTQAAQLFQQAVQAYKQVCCAWLSRLGAPWPGP